MNPEIDPDNLTPFQIPEDFLEQLFEFTGNASTESKGFMLCYVNQDGSPMILSKIGTQITEMGLRKALEKYLIQIEEADISIGGSQGAE
jgi:hypothetical protein